MNTTPAHAQQAADRTSKALAEAITVVRAEHPDLTYAEAAQLQAEQDGGAARAAYGNALVTKTIAAGGPQAAPTTPITTRS
jgi:Xaa-Pro aminopeptidase